MAWAKSKSLVLNGSKSKYMVIGTRNEIAKIKGYDGMSLTISGDNIDIVSEARILSVLIDEKLRFEYQVTGVVRNFL